MTGCSLYTKPFLWQAASAGFVWTCDINVPDRPCFPTRQGWFLSPFVHMYVRETRNHTY